MLKNTSQKNILSPASQIEYGTKNVPFVKIHWCHKIKKQPQQKNNKVSKQNVQNNVQYLKSEPEKRPSWFQCYQSKIINSLFKKKKCKFQISMER